MFFNIEISPLIITLLGVCILSFAVILCVYCIYVRRVVRRQRRCAQQSAPAILPAASVIVYACGEAEYLETLLPTILNQNYPGEFEVIVVNEGDSADVRNVIGALQIAYSNLHLTFTPDGARNLSRKKLALTLGIKAARHSVVVLTTADAIIGSPQWLSSMMRHFVTTDTGIVLGYAAPADNAAISRTATFNFACDSTAWISPAIGHKPYRGTELNIAYRRDLFFANKGFSRSLNLHAGDDDIFISEIATKTNTAVELSPESVVRFGSYNMASTLRDYALRYQFTRRFIHRKPLRWLLGGELAFWLCIVSGALAIIFDVNNFFSIGVVSLMAIGAYLCIALVWRQTTSALSLRRLTLTAPLLTLLHPFCRIALYIKGKISRQKKYTWD